MLANLKIRREWLSALLGFAEEGGPDDSALGTINVRLDAMFRDLQHDRVDIAVMPDPELQKLARWHQGWKCGRIFGAQVRIPLKGAIPTTLFEQLNAAPAVLLARLDQHDGHVICSPPQLFLRRTPRNADIHISQHVILIPVQSSKNQDSDTLGNGGSSPPCTTLVDMPLTPGGIGRSQGRGPNVVGQPELQRKRCPNARKARRKPGRKPGSNGSAASPEPPPG